MALGISLISGKRRERKRWKKSQSFNWIGGKINRRVLWDIVNIWHPQRNENPLVVRWWKQGKQYTHWRENCEPSLCRFGQAPPCTHRPHVVKTCSCLLTSRHDMAAVLSNSQHLRSHPCTRSVQAWDVWCPACHNLGGARRAQHSLGIYT